MEPVNFDYFQMTKTKTDKKTPEHGHLKSGLAPPFCYFGAGGGSAIEGYTAFQRTISVKESK